MPELDPLAVWRDEDGVYVYICPHCNEENECDYAPASSDFYVCYWCEEPIYFTPLVFTQIQKYMKVRVHFEDGQQDMTDLTIETLGGITGTVIDVPPFCSESVANVYLGQTVQMQDIKEGELLCLADPHDDFKTWNTNWRVSRIEQLPDDYVAPNPPKSFNQLNAMRNNILLFFLLCFSSCLFGQTPAIAEHQQSPEELEALARMAAGESPEDIWRHDGPDKDTIIASWVLYVDPEGEVKYAEDVAIERTIRTEWGRIVDQRLLGVRFKRIIMAESYKEVGQ